MTSLSEVRAFLRGRHRFEFLRSLALAASICTSIAGTAQAQGVLTVEVFANSAMHITPVPAQGQALPYKLSVYRLDALQRIETTLNQQLPQKEADARAWLQANQARLKREVTPQAVAAANGIALAHHYKIKRLPAMVIDRKAVVYGLTDVGAAIERYQATRGASAARGRAP